MIDPQRLRLPKLHTTCIPRLTLYDVRASWLRALRPILFRSFFSQHFRYAFVRLRGKKISGFVAIACRRSENFHSHRSWSNSRLRRNFAEAGNQVESSRRSRNLPNVVWRCCSKGIIIVWLIRWGGSDKTGGGNGWWGYLGILLYRIKREYNDLHGQYICLFLSHPAGVQLWSDSLRTRASQFRRGPTFQPR